MIERCNDRGSRRGAAAAEFALLLPVLTFLLLITVDFGRLFYSYIILGACARNAAIFASSATTTPAAFPDVTTAGQADASNLSPLPTVSSPLYSTTYNGTYTSTRPTTIDSTHDGYAKVTVTWTFNTIVTYPGIPSSMSLSRTCTMRIIPN